MKTNRYILSLLLLVVSAFNLLPANAQQNQYAIYNYRNDGDFNAWFNIDVDSITYSCIDTFGVEHDDVVVQEVWTPDSVYRIPINAIDSLAFRAPKPEFKDGIFHIVEAHVPYTVNVEDLTVTFSSDIPNSMLPSKGQVVISDIYGTPFDEGFAGRVVNIISNGGQIRIECEEVGLDDVYDQLVCVGKSICYSDDENTENLPSRAPRKIRINKDGVVELPLGKLSIDLLTHKEIDGWTEETLDKTNYVKLTAKPSLVIDYAIKYRVKGQEDVLKFVISNKGEYEFELQWPKTGKLVDWEKYLPEFIPIPTGIPGLYSKICFGGFLNIEGDAKIKAKIPFTIQNNIGYDSNKESYGGIVYDMKGTEFEMPELTASLNGSISGGIAFKFVTCIVSQKLSNVNVKVKAGPKLSGKFEISTNGFTDGGWSWYESMKDSKVTWEPLVIKVSGGVELFGKNKDWSYTLPIPDYIEFLKKKEYFLFPDFTAPALSTKTDYEKGIFQPTSMTTTVTRNLLFPVYVGLAFYDQDDNLVREVYSAKEYRFQKDWKNNNLQWDMSHYPAGSQYTIRPMIKKEHLYGTVKARPTTDFTVPTPVEFETDNLSLQIGKSQSVAINGGWGDYSLGHLNKTACDAELKKEGDNYYIQLLGKAKGLAPITINDLRSGESTTLIVDVVEEAIDLALSETTVSMKPNETAEVAITSGSGSYTVASSDEEVAVAAISNGNKVVIAARKAGTATITVTDTKTKQTATIAVTVTDPAPTDIPAEAIDLGLPSGTLWASYNVGATKPEEYGSYFAWGETQEKKSYYFTNYSLCDGTVSSCHNIGDDISGTEYDVAHVRWGSEWCMPSKDDFYELTRQCEHKETTVNGVKGYQFTGPNGKSIFLPYAGYFWNTENSKAGTNGSYWSSTLTTSVNHSQEMSFSKGEVLWDCYINRFAGLSVRPVKKGNSTTPDLSLESTSPVNLEMSQSSNINIVSGSGSYTAISSAPDVATAEVNNATVVITAHKAGSATITVTDTKTKQTATIAVTVTDGTDVSPGEAIDLGLPSGTLWASCNVGATKPEEYGDYFAWGETKPKKDYWWSTYKWCNGAYDKLTKYCNNSYDGNNGFTDNKTELDLEDDAAYVNWGSSWRMPSKEQQDELQSQCKWEWTQLNGVNGRKVTGPNGKSIFLPAAGFRYDTSLDYSGSFGGYWSRTLSTDDPVFAYGLLIHSGDVGLDDDGRCNGWSVRPVRR